MGIQFMVSYQIKKLNKYFDGGNYFNNMVCSCSTKKRACGDCIKHAQDYFNNRYPEIDCCQNTKMILSLASQDAEDKNLWQVYQDLSTYKLPIKDYEDDGTIIGNEIYKKMVDIQDTWYWSKKGEGWQSDMVKFISIVRSTKKIIPIFDISEEEMEVIKDEMVYFGGELVKDLDYFTRYFIYDILVNISGEYIKQKKYKEIYKKLENLKKIGKYPAKMDEPMRYMQKSVFYAVIKDLVNYFKSNKN